MWCSKKRGSLGVRSLGASVFLPVLVVLPGAGNLPFQKGSLLTCQVGNNKNNFLHILKSWYEDPMNKKWQSTVQTEALYMCKV